MSLLIFALVVVLLVALLIWAVGMLTMIPDPPRQIIMVLIVLLGVVAIANRAGLV